MLVAAGRGRLTGAVREAGAPLARAELLVPVVKGWCTESGVEITSLGVQVHGGMGYVEETGAAQYFRDSKIATIYEGTTGIQANDLVGRKTLANEGAVLADLLAEVEATVAALNAEMPGSAYYVDSLGVGEAVGGPVYAPVMLGTYASVLAGAIWGDHCSPISDTTILSSLATGSNHMDHVTTQMPIATVAAGIGAILYTIIALIVF